MTTFWNSEKISVSVTATINPMPKTSSS
ncbi:Putative uncharacterized protein [Lactococcus lactis subsp. lactis A12]|uniref:Uncharacterized protein n=1 Tax=Lactococcus lactis subsp. lactis A12 TaxID=1137134 RepID=S6F2D5_LACLL|nr:Putative uncharacterized protein [Lactococcus lactis subsp. lactis A12]